MAYNKKIEIQALVSGKDRIGNDRAVWQTIFRPWAEVNCVGGKEYYAAAQVNAQDDMVFKIRYTKKLSGKKAPDVRIVYKGDTYDVKHIDDYMEQHRELVIRAQLLNGGARNG